MASSSIHPAPALVASKSKRSSCGSSQRRPSAEGVKAPGPTSGTGSMRLAASMKRARPSAMASRTRVERPSAGAPGRSSAMVATPDPRRFGSTSGRGAGEAAVGQRVLHPLDSGEPRGRDPGAVDLHDHGPPVVEDRTQDESDAGAQELHGSDRGQRLGDELIDGTGDELRVRRAEEGEPERQRGLVGPGERTDEVVHRTLPTPRSRRVRREPSADSELQERRGHCETRRVQEAQLERALAGARSLAATLGLPTDEAIVLSDSNRVVARMLPCDAVARIAPLGWFSSSGEVELARRLAHESDAPIVELDRRVEPVIFRQDEFEISWWAYVETDPTPLAPEDYSRALERLHRVLHRIEVAGPSFTERLSDVRRWLTLPAVVPDLRADDRDLLLERLRPSDPLLAWAAQHRQLLHGEPHPGNVLNTAAGPRFIDLENCAWGADRVRPRLGPDRRERPLRGCRPGCARRVPPDRARPRRRPPVAPRRRAPQRPALGRRVPRGVAARTTVAGARRRVLVAVAATESGLVRPRSYRSGSMRPSEMARAMMPCWICSVPSKMSMVDSARPFSAAHPV